MNAAAEGGGPAPRRGGADVPIRERPLPVPDLIALLQEDHALYSGLGSADVVRIRGALLLALARGGLTPTALPYVLEELQSANEAYLTAAAAHSLRSFDSPDPAFVEPLLSALALIPYRDERVSLSEFGGRGGERPTTAIREILRTLGWMGPAARAALPTLEALRAKTRGSSLRQEIRAAIDRIGSQDGLPACCSSIEPVRDERNPARELEIGSVEFQDQDGECVRFDEFFVGKPSIVVFFYSRCDNPAKCPRTIDQLGRLQRRLRSEGLTDAVRTAAITYDPDYDRPAQLEQFRRSWGAEKGADHRFLRAVNGFDRVVTYFDLKVNYTAATVNRHRLEAYVLGSTGRILVARTRLQWEQDDLLNEVYQELRRVGSPAASKRGQRSESTNQSIQ